MNRETSNPTSNPSEEKQEEKQTEPEIKKEVREIHHHHWGEKGGFHFGKLFLGLIVITLGLYFLGQNMGIIPETWKFDIWQLWPLFIIFIGLSIISGRGWVSALVGIIITLLVIGLVLSLIYGNWPGLKREATETPIDIAKEVGITSAQINIKDGAGKILIGSNSDKLVEGKLATNIMEIAKTTEVKDSKQTVDLKITSPWQRGWWWNRTNDLSLKLNSDIPYSLDIDSGATDLNLDLSDIMAEEIKMDTGASSLVLRIGDKVKQSKVDINAGASSVKIYLPKTVGAKLTISSGLTSKDLDQFDQLDQQNYQSLNYDKTDKKVEMDLNLGASSVTVNWYEPSEKTEEGNVVEWKEAEDYINDCNVKAVTQKHNLEVTVTLKDGKEIKTTEPKIDSVIQKIRDAENKCGQVTINTE